MALSEEFITSVKKICEDFRNDDDVLVYEFDNDLDNAQRQYIHRYVKKIGIHSKSSGKGSHRHVVMSKSKQHKSDERSSSFPQAHHTSLRPLVDFPSVQVSAQVQQYFEQFPIQEFELRRNYSSCEEHEAPQLSEPKVVPKRNNNNNNGTSFSTLTGQSSTVRLNNNHHHQAPAAAQVKQRMTLPAWKAREEICSVVANHQVVIISGATGCGTSCGVVYI